MQLKTGAIAVAALVLVPFLVVAAPNEHPGVEQPADQTQPAASPDEQGLDAEWLALNRTIPKMLNGVAQAAGAVVKAKHEAEVRASDAESRLKWVLDNWVTKPADKHD